MVRLNMDESAQQLYQWLLKRSAGSSNRRVRAAGLLQTAVDALKLDLVDARQAFRTLRKGRHADYVPDMTGLPYTGYVQVKPPQTTEPPSFALWRSVLSADGVDPELQEALLPAHEAFADMAAEDLALLVVGLMRLRAAAPHTPGLFGFSLSARELLGSSKVLDRLPASARRLLGVVDLPSTPRYVVVAGPPAPQAVLLVENSTTFELAVRAGFSAQVALIAAYGYGLNMMSDSAAGWALVDSLASGHCEVLCRSGGGFDLSSLLCHPQLLFWGDLDREGLRIALALRSTLPQLALSALYAPMCEMVQDRARSHPYALACGKANQQAWQPSGDAQIDALAVLCGSRAVDQESVELGGRASLATQPLSQQPPML